MISAMPDMIACAAKPMACSARRAEPVDGDARHVDGQAGLEPGVAGHVEALLGLGEGAPHDDVVDLGGIEAGRPLERRLDGQHGQVLRAGGPVHALGAPCPTGVRTALTTITASFIRDLLTAAAAG